MEWITQFSKRWFNMYEEKVMEAWQERVVQEKKELGEKIDKLMVFIDDNPNFAALPEGSKLLLNTQLYAMQTYHTILRTRILQWSV